MVSRCMPLCRSFLSSFSSKTTWYLTMSSSWTAHRMESQPTGQWAPVTHWAAPMCWALGGLSEQQLVEWEVFDRGTRAQNILNPKPWRACKFPT